ncbi:MAG: SRPBCC family protein [Acidobacteriota bacterium]|nr:SRPBCC family protein [Acidobacteriota bacterium]
MKLRFEVRIAAPPQRVWPWVADPLRMARWNPKLVAIDRAASGELQAGEEYELIYRMSGRDTELRARVELAKPPVELAIRLWDEAGPHERPTVESYRLEARGDGTRLRQEIDLSRTGIPWPARLLMALLSRWGRPRDEPYLERLRRLVEEPQDPPNPASTSSTRASSRPGSTSSRS